MAAIPILRAIKFILVSTTITLLLLIVGPFITFNEVRRFTPLLNNAISNEEITRHIPLLPYPQSNSELALSRIILAEGLHNLTDSIVGSGITAEVINVVCETSGVSPNVLDVFESARILIARGGDCRQGGSPCARFVSWGEAAVGLCSPRPVWWEIDCGDLGNLATWLASVCRLRVGLAERAGARYFFEETSLSDVRVYRTELALGDRIVGVNYPPSHHIPVGID